MAEAEFIYYDKRSTELKAFDDTKAGVKGLVDAGVTKIPRIFKLQRPTHNDNSSCNSDFSIPTIDLKGIFEDSNTSTEVINRVRDASEKWGLFQVINHGIPVSILDEMIDGVRRFHEQDTEEKKEFYSRDHARKFSYFSTYDLNRSDVANWRDTFTCAIAPDPPKPEELPDVCRDIVIQYTNHMMQLEYKLLVLLSQALGLNPSHLEDIGCAKELLLVGHYYPACPEPELAIGSAKHTDVSFITILLQDQIGGLQILHEKQWVDVPPVPGALVVNIGDFLQLISNDKFKSVNHRVLSKQIGPRISVACFFRPPTRIGDIGNVYGPIKELLSEDNPPVYRETNTKEFMGIHSSKRHSETSPLISLRL